jgi:hypothetical protein
MECEARLYKRPLKRLMGGTIIFENRGAKLFSWLNKQVSVANLTTALPKEERLARTENENDRLIHVYQLSQVISASAVCSRMLNPARPDPIDHPRSPAVRLSSPHGTWLNGAGKWRASDAEEVSQRSRHFLDESFGKQP